MGQPTDCEEPNDDRFLDGQLGRAAKVRAVYIERRDDGEDTMSTLDRGGEDWLADGLTGLVADDPARPLCLRGLVREQWRRHCNPRQRSSGSPL